MSEIIKVKTNYPKKQLYPQVALNYQQAGIYMHQKKQQFQPEENNYKN